MWPATEYLKKYLLEAAILDTKNKYEREGYIAQVHDRLGDLDVDLKVSSQTKEIYFEFKIGPQSKRPTAEVVKLKKLIRARRGAEFKLVYVAPPADPLVEIDDIGTILEQVLMNDMPSELDSLSTHTYIDEVADVEFTKVYIESNSIDLSGTCTIGVRLQYGSGSDLDSGHGDVTDDSYPATFELKLDGELEVVESDIDVDTSSFYE